MASCSGSSHQLNEPDGQLLVDKPRKASLKKKDKSGSSKDHRDWLKEDSSPSHSKKSPYVSTLQKLKRRVRKTHPICEPTSSTAGNRRKVSNIHRYFSASSAGDEGSNDVSSLSEESQDPNELLEAPAASNDNRDAVDEDEQESEKSSYAYEVSNALPAAQAGTSGRSQSPTPAYDVESPEKDDPDDQSYIYIDMSELFEKPNVAASNLSNMQAPNLYPSSNDNSSDSSSNTQQVSNIVNSETEKKNVSETNGVEGSTFQYSDPYFPSLMQDSIRELALDGEFADVTIEVDGHRIRCHRMILAASSKYFKAMFCNNHRERNQASVKIHAVSADVMKVLIRYAYTSYLEVDRYNVQNVLEAASLFQFTRVMEACSNYFVSELSVDNAPGIMELAHRHNLNHLLVLARLKCVTCFEELREKSDFTVLSVSLLESLLSRSDLMARMEEEVFRVAMAWCQHDPEGRRKYVPQLLKHVKLPLVDPVFLTRHVETHPLIRNNPDVFDLMMEARRYHAVGDIREGSRIVPRHNAFIHQVFLAVGGCNKDDNFISDVTMLDFQHKTRAVLCQLPNAKNSTRGINSENNSEKKTKWAEFACTNWKGNIVVTGGKETKKEAWMYMTNLRQWVEMASLNTVRWRHRMVVCDAELYTVGGYDGLLRVDSLEKYKEQENRWLEKRHMREGVSSAAVCECNRKIYVIGGGPSIRVSTEKVQVYNPVDNSWSLSTPMPEPAKCINAASLRGVIYVVGGTLRKILTFDSTSEEWETVGDPLLTERASCGITVCNDLIFIVGGRDETGKAISNVSYLDTESKAIRSECNMSFGISHHGCITLQKFDHMRMSKIV